MTGLMQGTNDQTHTLVTSRMLTDPSCAFVNLADSYGFFDKDPSSATHYLMDGYRGGHLTVPEQHMTVFNNAVFNDIQTKKSFYLIERRRGSLGRLVLDIDYGDRVVTLDQSISFAQMVIQKVISVVDFQGRLRTDSALISTCGTSNLHVCFPDFVMEQTDCIRVVSSLPSLLLCDTEVSDRLEGVTAEELKKIIDISVVVCNGLRVNGSRKASKGKDCGNEKVYMASHLVARNRITELFKFPAKARGFFDASLINPSCENPVILGLNDSITPYVDRSVFAAARAVLSGSKNKNVIARGDPLQVLGTANLSEVERVVSLIYPRPFPLLKDVQALRCGQRIIINVTLDSSSETSRFCHNIEGLHRNNQTYVRIDASGGTACMKCRCRCPRGSKPVACSMYSSEPLDINIDTDSISKEAHVFASVGHFIREQPLSPARRPPLMSMPFVQRRPVAPLKRRKVENGSRGNAICVRTEVCRNFASVRLFLPPSHADYQANKDSTYEIARLHTTSFGKNGLPVPEEIVMTREDEQQLGAAIESQDEEGMSEIEELLLANSQREHEEFLSQGR